MQLLHWCGLRLHQRFGAGQRGERLVPVARRQQAGEIGTEVVSLGKRMKQGIEVHPIVL